MTVVRELVTRLNFKADTKEVKAYETSLADVRKTALKVGAAIGALAGGAVFLARRLASTGNEIAKSAVEAGIASDEFQNVAFALGQITQLSSGESQRALLRLNDSIGRARTEGGRYAETLMQIGFSQEEITSGTIDNEEAFRRATKAISATGSAQIAAAMSADLFGTRMGMRLGPALVGNAEALEAARKEAQELGGGFSQLALDESESLMDSFGRVSQILKSVRGIIAEFLLPAVRQVVDLFVAWFRANSEILQQNLRRWLEMLSRGFSGLMRILRALFSPINQLISFLGGWERALRLVFIALSALIAMKFSKFIAIFIAGVIGATRSVGLLRGALVALQKVGILLLFLALSLVIEDLITWIMGGESAVGRWLGSFEDFRRTATRALQDLINSLRFLLVVARPLGQIFRGLFTFNFSEILEGLRGLSRIFRDILGSLAGKLRSSLGNPLNWIPSFSEIFKGIQSFGSTILNWASSLSSQIRSLFSQMVPDFVQRGIGGIRDKVGGLLSSSSPEDDLRRSSSKSVSVNARTEATLQVPTGTSEEQIRSLETQTERIFSEHWDKEIRRSLWDMQGTES